MPFRPSDQDPNVAELLVGEFNQDSRYSTFRENGSRSYLLVYSNRGGGLIEHAEGKFEVEAGDVLLFAPRHLHGYGTLPRIGFWDLQWAHFHPRPDWEPLVRWPECGRGVSVISPPPHLQTLVSENLRQAVRFGYGSPLELRLALNRFEEILLRLVHFSGNDRNRDARIALVQERLRRDYFQEWTVESMAAAVDLSVSRFGHLFRAETGSSPRDYLESVRLEHGRRLLAESSLSVGEVSRRIGFTDEFYFSNRFRRAAGVSPREFRRSFLA